VIKIVEDGGIGTARYEISAVTHGAPDFGDPRTVPADGKIDTGCGAWLTFSNGPQGAKSNTL